MPADAVLVGVVSLLTNPVEVETEGVVRRVAADSAVPLLLMPRDPHGQVLAHPPPFIAIAPATSDWP